VLLTPLTRSISCNDPLISTARRKSALVLEIIQGKTTVAAASRQFDLTPAEMESWVEDGKRGMENALRAKPEDVGKPPHAASVRSTAAGDRVRAHPHLV
jgi:transposase-like protein